MADNLDDDWDETEIVANDDANDDEDGAEKPQKTKRANVEVDNGDCLYS